MSNFLNSWHPSVHGKWSILSVFGVACISPLQFFWSRDIHFPWKKNSRKNLQAVIQALALSRYIKKLDIRLTRIWFTIKIVFAAWLCKGLGAPVEMSRRNRQSLVQDYSTHRGMDKLHGHLSCSPNGNAPLPDRKLPLSCYSTQFGQELDYYWSQIHCIPMWLGPGTR